MKGNKRKFEFDELKMYYEIPFEVNDYITIYQPKIGQIMDFGDVRFYEGIQPFLCNPTSYRLPLWDKGIDWNKIDDFDLFIMLYNNMDKECVSLLFKDFDFSELFPVKDPETGRKALSYVEFDSFGNIISENEVINEETYLLMAEYIRTMFNQHPKVEKAKGKTTKQSIIDEDRMNLEYQMKQNNGVKHSILLPLISSMVNHPGFKYKKKELVDVGIVEFMDSVQRIPVHESAIALISGVYSGMIDTSKINIAKETNWLRDLSESS